MKTIKVNTTQTIKVLNKSNPTSHSDAIVAPGKLVLIHVKPGEDGFFMRDGVFKPIIISETEKIEVGDKYVNGITNGIDNVSYQVEEYKGGHLPVTRYKILALPEHFSPKHLQAIVNGKMKDRDEVYVECVEDWEDSSLSSRNYNKVNIIKLNSDNHITLHKVEQKMYSRDEVENLITLAWATASVYGVHDNNEADCKDWIKHNL